MPRLTATSFDDPAWPIVTQGANELAQCKFADAIVSFTQAIDAFTGRSPVAAVVETFICRGVAFGRSGDHKSSLEDFSSAIRLNSNHGLAYYNRAQAHEWLGNFRQAIDDYSRAIDILPADSMRHLRRGVCRKRLGEIADARRDFAEVRRLRLPAWYKKWLTSRRT